MILDVNYAGVTIIASSLVITRNHRSWLYFGYNLATHFDGGFMIGTVNFINCKYFRTIPIFGASKSYCCRSHKNKKLADKFGTFPLLS